MRMRKELYDALINLKKAFVIVNEIVEKEEKDDSIYLCSRQKLYGFDELSETAQANAINNWVALIIDEAEQIGLDNLDKEHPVYKAYKKSEEMRTPWFINEYVLEYAKDNILKDVRFNLYTADGKTWVMRNEVVNGEVWR